jgi:hypothetical protein
MDQMIGQRARPEGRRLRSSEAGERPSGDRALWGLALLCAFLLPGQANAQAVEAASLSRPDIELTWYDSDLLVPTGLETISGEVESIFRNHGRQVILRPGGGIEAPSSKPLRVIVVRRPASAWDLGDDVMGVAPGTATPRRNIYLIEPTVREVLGRPREIAAEESEAVEGEVALALARVIAHEVVHAVAPDHPHAETGMMSGRQKRKSLLAKRFRLDPGCAGAFDEALSRLQAAGTL